MQIMIMVAGLLVVLIGCIHSVLGERLIFRRMRGTGLIPTQGAPRLGEGHVRILWATWHLVTVLGWVFGAILIRLGFPTAPEQMVDFVRGAVILAMAIGSLLVLVATKGKHPGWIGLLVVAVLAWLG